MSEPKKIIVAPLMPTRGRPHFQAEHSLRVASIMASKQGIDVFHVRHRTSSAIHENRNCLIADLVVDSIHHKQPFTHVLMQDDDIRVPADAIIKLVAADKPIVGALCTTRSHPPIPNARIFYEDEGLWENILEYDIGLSDRPKPNSKPYGAIGTGLVLLDYEKAIKPMAMIYLDCLYERDVLGMSEDKAKAWSEARRVAFNQYPNAWWFRWLPPLDGVGENSEDVSFCWMAKRYLDIQTWVDSSIRPGHIGEVEFTIDDFEARRTEAIAQAKKEGRYHPATEEKSASITPRVFVAMKDAAMGAPMSVPLVEQPFVETKAITVLIPSRQRPDLLLQSVQSLLNRAANPRAVEILIRLDDDDGTAQAVIEWNRTAIVDKSHQVPITMLGPRHGYRNLHQYYNGLAEHASGDWLMQWNDDAVMETVGWDQKIHAQGGGLKILNATGRLNLFPIVSRELYEVLGHWSLQAHSDSWLQVIGRMNGIEYPVDLSIRHLRDEGLNDQTKSESLETYATTSPEFFSRVVQEKLRRDLKKVHKAVERMQKQALKDRFSANPVYDFNRQKDAWASPPVDDVGYVQSGRLLRFPSYDLMRLIEAMSETRYRLDGWRNYQNKWREYLGLDSTTGKRILDFGCGVGLEALQFAKTGNQVLLADIAPSNLELAKRVLSLYGFTPEACLSVSNVWPFLECDPVDIFYANGVLHHIPYASDIMRRASELLTPGGKAYLMLYSDRGWQKYAGALPAVDFPVERDPSFQRFVRAFDAVGDYADWYNREKLELKFGQWFTVEECQYITPDDRYLVAILKVRDGKENSEQLYTPVAEGARMQSLEDVSQPSTDRA